MNGPDLSHLLDGDDSERPSPAVLEGIVRRHRRLRARRARTAATLGLVLVVAGAGVGIGLSHQGATSSASGRSNSGPAAPRGSTLGPTSNHPLPPAPVGVVPTGLGWIDTEVGLGPDAESSMSLKAAPPLRKAGRLQMTFEAPTSSGSASASCGTVGCPTLSPTELAIGDLPIHHLFNRTSDGITVRVFTAMWAVAPLELVPTGSSAGSSGAGSAGGGSAGGGAAAAARSPSCLLNRILVVEVSDAGAVGLVTVPLGPSAARPFDVVADQVIGLREGSPIAVVVVHTTAVASAARAEFAAGGSDQMSVVDGWAVLVRKLAAPRSGSSAGGKLSQAPLGQATVYALSRSGSVLEDAVLPGTGVLALAVGACRGIGGNHKTPGAGSTAKG